MCFDIDFNFWSALIPWLVLATIPFILAVLLIEQYQMIIDTEEKVRDLECALEGYFAKNGRGGTDLFTNDVSFEEPR